MNARKSARLAVAGMSGSGLAAVLIAFAGDWFWLADLFAQLRPQYCLWLSLASLGALALQHRPSLLLATMGLLLNALALAPFAGSLLETKQSHARDWTFATINLLQGNKNSPLVERYLRENQPDIVVFQEVTPRWAAQLEVLADLYPHRFVQSSTNQFGLAMFSRQPPVAQSARPVGDRPRDFAIFGTWQSDGQLFSIAGIHPDKPDAGWKTLNRANYLGRIASWAEERASAGDAVVVIGDYNTTPWSASLRSFTKRTGLRNANQGRIFSATWNVWQPHRLLIDHALFSKHWAPHTCTIGPDVGSDHRPLLIKASLAPD